jgi:hypothetical protein
VNAVYPSRRQILAATGAILMGGSIRTTVAAGADWVPISPSEACFTSRPRRTAGQRDYGEARLESPRRRHRALRGFRPVGQVMAPEPLHCYRGSGRTPRRSSRKQAGTAYRPAFFMNNGRRVAARLITLAVAKRRKPLSPPVSRTQGVLTAVPATRKTQDVDSLWGRQ